MRSYWFIVLGGVAIGLGLVVPPVWRYRREFVRGFKEVWGIAVVEDPVMQKRVDALRNAKPIGWLAIVELTAIAIGALVAFSIGAYNGGAAAWTCFALSVALVVLFNAVLLAQMPPLTDRVERQIPGGSLAQDPSPGALGRGSDFRLPAWWLVGVAICVPLVVGGLVAAATGDLTLRLILGVPGALGLLVLGLWARHSRRREPVPSL
ncbi:MAG: hypothetical protein JST31_07200 [Actinobacteria bacterium]|nr:hypothetical protein [Actinomycetota bacterium]